MEAMTGTEAVEFTEDHAPCEMEVAHRIEGFVVGAFVFVT